MHGPRPDFSPRRDDLYSRCPVHGVVRDSYWQARNSEGGQEEYDFCALCMGEWLARQFPVKPILQ